MKHSIIHTIRDSFDENLEARIYKSTDDGSFFASLVCGGQTIGKWYKFKKLQDAKDFAEELIFRLEPSRPTLGLATILVLSVMLPLYVTLVWLLITP
tara:strand:- start:1207 stop:1497 length:291 start_codon:yes stop_codon:yes gene_type:complete